MFQENNQNTQSEIKNQNKNENKDTLSVAKLGRSYYDIVDVSSQNIINNIVSESSNLGLNQSQLREISNIVKSELERSKDWGSNILFKLLK